MEKWKDVLGAAAERGLLRVRRIVESGHKGMPPDASILSDARLILCLKGTAHYEGQEGGEPGVFSIQKGQALFVAPHRWTRAVPKGPYLVLGLIFEDEALRLYLLKPENDRKGCWKTQHQEECIHRHPLPAEGRTFCRILERAQSFPLYHRRIAEALIALSRNVLDAPEMRSAGKAMKTWQAASRYVADHLHEPLGREQVAGHLRIHPNHLSRLCASFSQGSFAHFVQDCRLERARLLLMDSRLNVTEAALLSGFSSATYFIRLYRKRFGTTPGAAREGSY